MTNSPLLRWWNAARSCPAISRKGRRIGVGRGANDPILGPLFRKRPNRAAFALSDPPTNRRRRRWIGKLLAALSILILVWIAWPYYAILSLMQATRDGDVPTLERRVDWNALRQALRGDLNARLLQSLRNKKGSDDAMATGFATLLGPAVINQMIDGYVTPQAIATLSRPGNGVGNANDLPPKIDKSASLIRQVHWEQIKYAFFSGGPFAFKVNVLPQSDPPLKNPIGLDFAWNGDWHLTRITLPDDVLKETDDADSRGASADAAPAAEPKKKLAATEPPNATEPAPVELTLRSKRFKPADYKASADVQAAIIFELSIANRSAKPIRAFDGTLTFTDLLDNQILSSKLAINELIGTGSIMNWAGSIKYNEFLDGHKRLKNEDQSNLKTKFVVRKVLYEDGSMREYP